MSLKKPAKKNAVLAVAKTAAKKTAAKKPARAAAPKKTAARTTRTSTATKRSSRTTAAPRRRGLLRRLTRTRGFIRSGINLKFFAFMAVFAVIGTAVLLVTHAATAVITVNDNTSGTGLNQFNYAGTWGTTTTQGAFNNDEHFSNTANSSYTVQFSGTQIKVFSMKHQNYGQAAYSVDGGAETVVDHYAASRVFNFLAYTSPTMPNGVHTLKVRVLGTKQAAAGGTYVPADKVEIISVSPVTQQATTSGTKTSYNNSLVGSGLHQYSFSSNWGTMRTDGAHNNDEHFSNTAGATYSFKFSGSQARVYSMQHPNYGLAAYSVDGGAETVVDHFAPTRVFGYLAYTTPILANAEHTIKVRVLGTKQAAAQGAYVAADRIEVTVPASSAPAPTEPPASSVSINNSVTGSNYNQYAFSSNWGSMRTDGAYNNDEHFSNTAGASYTMKFNGTQVKVYSMKHPNYGLAAYSVDGGAETVVDHYHSERVFNFMAYSSPVLASGDHTVKVRVLGTKQAAAQGAYVAADRIEVLGGAAASATPPPTTTPIPAPTPITTTPPPSTTSGTAPPAPVTNVRDFGATGNGSTDDTAAIQRAIDASNGGSVYFPAGTYVQRDVIHVGRNKGEKNGVKLWGYTGAEIKSVTQNNVSIWFKGNNQGLYGLKLTSTATGRLDGFQNYRITAKDTNFFEVKDSTIIGGPAANVYIWGSNDFRFTGNLVQSNLADAYHVTGGSRRGYVANNIARNAGDDCFAAVSYASDNAVVTDVTFENNRCEGGHARGLAAVGSLNVTFRNNYVEETKAACIYVAGEGSFGTYGNKNTKFLNNTVYHCNNDVSRADHAAIFGYSAPGYKPTSTGQFQLFNEDILIDGTVVRDTLTPGRHMAYLYGTVTRLTISNTTVTGDPNKKFFLMDPTLQSGQYNMLNNTFNGAKQPDHRGF